MNRRGFTLIEILVTLAILAILILLTIPVTQTNATREKEKELRRALIQIREAIDNYKRAVDQGRIALTVQESGYPATLNTLVTGVVDQTNPNRQMIYFLRAIPRDPFADSDNPKPEDTWGVRSYQSPPDQPQPGTDVFDVYSLSKGVGLNGVPYRQW